MGSYQVIRERPLANVRLFQRDEMRAAYRVQGGICAICGGRMPPLDDYHGNPPSREHVIPKSWGGRDCLGNIVAAHHRCNMRKANRRPTGCELIWLQAVNARLGVEPVRW
jgi:5-methylcytosine-specific restriction endonuclease McrA